VIIINQVLAKHFSVNAIGVTVMIRAVVTNRGAVCDAKGCRELMHFSIYL